MKHCLEVRDEDPDGSGDFWSGGSITFLIRSGTVSGKI